MLPIFCSSLFDCLHVFACYLLVPGQSVKLIRVLKCYHNISSISIVIIRMFIVIFQSLPAGLPPAYCILLTTGEMKEFVSSALLGNHGGFAFMLDIYFR